MKVIFCVLALALMLLNLSCTQRVDMASERTTLLDTDKEWAAAAKEGDVARLTTFWSDDATNYFPGALPAEGKKAILALVQKNRALPGFSLTWEPTEAVVSSSGDLGYTSGTFALSLNGAEGTPQTKRGHYVCIWKKKADESWKCAVESSIFGPPSER